MAETDSDDSAGGIAQRIAELLVDRVLPFPLTGGFLAGIVSFVVGYLGVGGYMLSRGALGGSLGEQITAIGYVFYNSHTIAIIYDTTQAINPTPHPVAGAAVPYVYYAMPILALLAASVVFTALNRPDEQSAAFALLTGVSMTIGYLLVALVGTYVFTRSQVIDPPSGDSLTTTVHPHRVQTLVYGTLYPLVVGTIGSIPAQAVLIGPDEPAAEGESAPEADDAEPPADAAEDA